MDILNPVKQDIVSTGELNIKSDDYPIEDKPWQYPQSANTEKQDCFNRTNKF